MCKKMRSRVSLFALIALVLSQFMTAAHACQQLAPFAAPPVPVAAPMPADCTGMDGAPMTDDAPSPLCLAHCEHAAQFHQNAVPDIPAAVRVVLFEVLHPDMAGNATSGVFAHPLFLSLTDGSPPLRIQYQVFRI